MTTWHSITVRHVDNDGSLQERTYRLSPYCLEAQSLLDDGSHRVQLDFISDETSDVSQAPPEILSGLPSAEKVRAEINPIQAAMDAPAVK